MRLPTRKPVNGDPIALRRLVATGLVEILDCDPLTPVTVVRLAGVGRYTPDGFATPPVLATLLASLHTRPGDTIATVGADAGFDAVGDDADRHHRPLNPWTATDDPAAGTIALLVMRADVVAPEASTIARYMRLLTPTGLLAITRAGTRDSARIQLHPARDLNRMVPVGRTVGQAMTAANHIGVYGEVAVLTHRT